MICSPGKPLLYFPYRVHLRRPARRPNEPGDPYQVFDANTMLDYINPNAQKPLDVTILTRKGCPFCGRAKGMLRDRRIDFEELVLGKEISGRTLRA
jgi:hypothetical protein